MISAAEQEQHFESKLRIFTQLEISHAGNSTIQKMEPVLLWQAQVTSISDLILDAATVEGQQM